MKKSLLVLLVLFLGIQLVPTERTNPQILGDVHAPAEVVQILRKACYDCHSNETVWPWYAKVAPTSWLVTHDVKEAREHMNLSHWSELNETRRQHAREEIFEEVDDGHMPPWYYRGMHSEARLTDHDKGILKRWALQNRRD